MIEYRRLAVDDASLTEVLGLLRKVFPRAKQFSMPYLRWMYCQNPLGPAVGSNAFAQGRLVGHVAGQRLLATYGDRSEPGILIHNVGTDPEFQGRGIFARLLRECVDNARADGCTHMVAVPNASSTPGFLRSLQCQSVTALAALVGFGPMPAVGRDIPVLYRRQWSPEQLVWRLNGPGRTYASIATATGHWLVGRSGWPGVAVALDHLGLAETGCPPEGRRFPSPLTLWIGLGPHLDWSWRAYFPIPGRLRPAPLNLVFLDLTPGQRRLDPTRIRFSALDFDIY